MKVTLQEIRERTYKPIDAWWTVLLVDPLASRLVLLVAPYRWITPNVLTLIATIIGAGSMVSFAQGDQQWLIVGAVLFHLSFVVDCMDGKIARLNGTGTVFGQWLDFVLDRVRVFFCAITLFGGQYAQHHDVKYLWLMSVAIFLDLIRYLNGSQVSKVRRGMTDKLNSLKYPVELSPEPAQDMSEPGDEAAEETTDTNVAATIAAARPKSLKSRVGAYLKRNRIRTHLFSGIEYEMFVYILAPLTGLIFSITVFAGAAMLAFEFFLIYKLYRTTTAYPAKLAAAQEKYDAYQQGQVPTAL
ncbi:CDP-alcohol phosphatidyltransferase family protein [Actinoplanes awajinensis]|uniref:CDP-alcohol phosphatidyltransferase n=1 Tax=Actinoplanes awajinensis subsp. mycoplanecinus TaxID=135947 RepID=A0A0X3UY65_9ACTN|nr:CDP-alcohol phosphatidyltransferase family protein [Actinoplanes awajinensis]KUL35926.1 CDP-alcohol phosphatidyltransferase [Actinoplanes awajinensis subsp. mycoplanecinus]